MDYMQFYFSFVGRISRSDLWKKGVLVSIGISIAVFILDAGFGANSTLVIIWNVLAAWPTAALYTKRLHDRNRTGWWSLFFFVITFASLSNVLMRMAESPLGAIIFFIALIVGFWLSIEILFLKGTSGDNRFGKEPLASI